jgi:hypothetical protein
VKEGLTALDAAPLIYYIEAHPLMVNVRREGVTL